jgi:hypothetical protein
MQLKRLWGIKPTLSALARVYGGLPLSIAGRQEFTDDEATSAFFSQMGSTYERGKFHFVPLVEEGLRLNVSLDILFYVRTTIRSFSRAAI